MSAVLTQEDRRILQALDHEASHLEGTGTPARHRAERAFIRARYRPKEALQRLNLLDHGEALDMKEVRETAMGGSSQDVRQWLGRIADAQAAWGALKDEIDAQWWRHHHRAPEAPLLVDSVSWARSSLLAQAV